MCASMVDIQSATAEIRRGKKKRTKKEQMTGWKYIWPALLHRAAITKVMIGRESQKPVQKAARWRCGVCGRGVGSNSIQCTSCHKWVHKKCSGIKGSMYNAMRSFICRGWSNPVISTGHTSVGIGSSENLEVVDKFCYLGDMLSVDAVSYTHLTLPTILRV